MRKYTGRHSLISQKLKSLGAFLAILLLLPYVITVFVHGADQKERVAKQEYVKVEKDKGRGDGEKRIVAEVPWEEYFLGVLALEAPKESEPEMLKAQAVLARTKLYQELDSGEEKIFKERYLSREELEEQWREEGDKTQYERLKQAIADTENQVLFYGENYAWTPFHKASNGMTRDAGEVLGVEEYPYLKVRECPLDKEADAQMQITTYSYEEVQVACQPFLVAVEEKDAEKIYEIEDFEIVSLDTAGYVRELRIGDTICSGDEFRDALKLPSSAFSLQESHGKLKITTSGIGHGLGMSQWTANAMAKEGKNYEEILQFFFEGTEIKDGGIISGKME